MGEGVEVGYKHSRPFKEQEQESRRTGCSVAGRSTPLDSGPTWGNEELSVGWSSVREKVVITRPELHGAQQ